MAIQRKPVVLVCADRKMAGVHPFHMAGEKYIKAVVEGAGAIPLILPALAHSQDVIDLLDQVDGFLLTGGYANIEPHHYGGPAAPSEEIIDPARDSATLPLIPELVKRKIPLLGICRGFQEINVAFGGSIHYRVHQVEGMADHREDGELTLDQQYAVAHPVTTTEAGRLRGIVGQTSIMVNSLHGQGIDRLGEGLLPEATADDGLIEAVSVKDAEAFTMAVQWHPEWKLQQHPQYLSLFEAFGNACRERAKSR
ncbi:Gamma-glutamyl-gamma-aminobutyrate hydrolase PuuD [Sinobacterium norvegicum]|uniref:Gamma-glutamyl-gamma-aminobutyrate hydrolase PuuD n=1 Tax=Sinobacterium norvegicum TaxID=1641715 RepID=A0ABM9ABV8_9GAMM|nr:gamma-glutamyl-gamma-aminobutyrate hydrolase family protein [Sinobacterium norvegicum]CAH0990087.1 Gamma-glutamyl-gamma-aminobutyrate hydrolase PuuD [Sinobacterium norvegicum]